MVDILNMRLASIYTYICPVTPNCKFCPCVSTLSPTKGNASNINIVAIKLPGENKGKVMGLATTVNSNRYNSLLI